jgi:hypothetical protein
MHKRILFFALLFSVSVFGQSHPSRRAIMGIVKDTKGTLIANVAVTATASLGEGLGEYKIKKKGTTGEDGRYMISRLTPAIYTVTFSKKGYEKMVYRIRGKDDQDTIIDVVLPPVR